EGTRHDGLATIRITDDRFFDYKRRSAFYVSQLAGALGEWPWVDVLMSSEEDLLRLSVLSAGVVGVGDPIGALDTAMLARTMRADGKLVKPDAPLVPLDSTILSDARADGRPFVAATYTDFGGGMRAHYVYAMLAAASADHALRIDPAELGE